ncbi:MAG: prepilin peptidase [Sporichthyaceae bacterium]
MAVSAIWGALAAALGLSADLPAFLYLSWIGVALAAIDLRHHRLPDALVLPSYPIALALLGVAAIADTGGEPLIRAVVGATLTAGFYYLIALLRPGGIGFGDVKLAGLLGLQLGWIGWTEIAAGPLIAFATAAVVATALLLLGRVTRTSRLPFGPFMLGGSLVAILGGA